VMGRFLSACGSALLLFVSVAGASAQSSVGDAAKVACMNKCMANYRQCDRRTPAVCEQTRHSCYSSCGYRQ
jgi:hypothetical protein